MLRGRDTGRETFLVKVAWEDDWPVFKNGKNIRLQTGGRNGQQLVHQASWNADLSKESLELGWYQKRKSIWCDSRFISFSLKLDSRHSIEEGVVVIC
jgi:beta-xylosidase